MRPLSTRDLLPDGNQIYELVLTYFFSLVSFGKYGDFRFTFLVKFFTVMWYCDYTEITYLSPVKVLRQATTAPSKIRLLLPSQTKYCYNLFKFVQMSLF